MAQLAPAPQLAAWGAEEGGRQGTKEPPQAEKVKSEGAEMETDKGGGL